MHNAILYRKQKINIAHTLFRNGKQRGEFLTAFFSTFYSGI
jgi:hypothetical protein